MTTELEKFADGQLATFSMRHESSGGRVYPEPDQPYRTCFQRDRDRIIHSKAFRRLGYKTQVFVNSEGDNYRTRLTHSLEVGQIARSVAGALKLNVDFAETLALAHDLGHTPFGHAGQETLHELMLRHGGFEHNRQSLRIVSALEVRYPSFNGLNLTRSTLEGMMKHRQTYDCDIDLKEICEKRSHANPSLESALVDLCDRIAYNHHDLEDGLDSGFLNPEDLSELPVWNEAQLHVRKEYGKRFEETRLPVRIRTVIRAMMNRCIMDLIRTTEQNIRNAGIESLDDVLGMAQTLYPVRFSNDMNEILAQMQHFLKIRLYRHPLVMRMSRRGSRIIDFLFHEYIENPEILPSHVQNRVGLYGVHRVVSDYIAGMTDRFALEQHSYLSGGR